MVRDPTNCKADIATCADIFNIENVAEATPTAKLAIGANIDIIAAPNATTLDTITAPISTPNPNKIGCRLSSIK